MSGIIRKSWNNSTAASYQNIGQKRLAMADAMPFDDIIKNLIAAQTMIMPDGSIVRTRRQDGGVDRIETWTPSQGGAKEEKKEEKKYDIGEYFFAIQLWNTKEIDFAEGDDAYSIGYAIAEITEKHTITIKQVILYPIKKTGLTPQRLYTTQYQNKADVFSGSNPKYISDYKWLLGPNNEELSVYFGDSKYWELNSDGKWLIDTTRETIRPMTSVKIPDATFLFSEHGHYDYKKTSEMKLSEVDGTGEVITGPLYTEELISTLTESPPNLIGGHSSYLHEWTELEEYPTYDRYEGYASRDGKAWCFFYQISHYEDSCVQTTHPTEELEHDITHPMHIFGICEEFWGLDYGAAEASVHSQLQDWWNTSISNTQNTYPKEVNSKYCSIWWFESESGFDINEHSIFAPGGAGVVCCNGTGTLQMDRWLCSAEYTHSKEHALIAYAKLFLNAFEDVVEIPISFAEFDISTTVSHKYYEPDNKSGKAFFAGSAVLEEYINGLRQNSDDPASIVIIQVDRRDGKIPLVRYCELPAKFSTYQDIPYVAITNGRTSYYTNGACFWGERIVEE